MRFTNYKPQITLHHHEVNDGIVAEFMARCPADLDLITEYEEYVVDDMSLVEFAQFNKAVMEVAFPATITGYSSSLIAVENADTLVLITNNEQNEGRSTETLNRVTIAVTAVGRVDVIKALLELIEAKFPRKSYTSLQWWYPTPQGLDHMSMSLNNTDKVYDEFYPWLKQGQAKYFDEFIASTAPLLFISGAPGTGKTSFIRTNISRHNMNAYVGYDPELFKRDDMFISFLQSKRDHVMILEDAEEIVLPRDTGGNSMMSRFLNVSDGLLKNVKKKFIFTTNETNFDKIDEALIRPGRCFDYTEFRILSYDEAYRAATAAGLNVPTVVKDYTIAELFNQRERNIPGHRFGFAA